MKRPENNKWLDDELTKAIGSEKSEPDFEKWQQSHPEAVETLTSRASRQFSAPKRPLDIRKTIMRSKITKLAAAAAIIVVAVVSLTFLEKSVTPAYGLEQTIQANHTVRYLHIINFKAGEDEPKEFWLEFDEYGQMRNVRQHTPAWDSPSDGAKVAVWKENIAQVWLKKKNVLATIRDKTVAARVLKLVEKCDPRLAVEHLYEQEQQGKVVIDVNEPSDKAEPIAITATYLPKSSTPNRRWVLFVDQATKLVIAIEIYQLKDGEYQYLGLLEFYDYNQPIEAEMFTLDKVPADAIRLDQVSQDIGLAQGDLTDKEIAAEVVRQFFEALIAKDYGEAGRLYQGIEAETMREAYGGVSFLRIVSIGEARPEPKYGKLRVPCTVEIEKDGEITQWQPHPEGLLVGPVNNQADRWTIFGGI